MCVSMCLDTGKYSVEFSDIVPKTADSRYQFPANSHYNPYQVEG